MAPQPDPDFMRLFQDVSAVISGPNRTCMRTQLIELRDLIEKFHVKAFYCDLKTQEDTIKACFEGILKLFHDYNDSWMETERSIGQVCKAFTLLRVKLELYVKADIDVLTTALVKFSKQDLPNNSDEDAGTANVGESVQAAGRASRGEPMQFMSPVSIFYFAFRRVLQLQFGF